MCILLIQLQFLPIFLWKCVKNLNLMVFVSFYQRLYIFSNKNEIIREYFLVDYVITISEYSLNFWNCCLLISLFCILLIEDFAALASWKRQ